MPDFNVEFVIDEPFAFHLDLGCGQAEKLPDGFLASFAIFEVEVELRPIPCHAATAPHRSQPGRSARANNSIRVAAGYMTSISSYATSGFAECSPRGAWS